MIWDPGTASASSLENTSLRRLTVSIWGLRPQLGWPPEENGPDISGERSRSCRGCSLPSRSSPPPPSLRLCSDRAADRKYRRCRSRRLRESPTHAKLAALSAATPTQRSAVRPPTVSTLSHKWLQCRKGLGSLGGRYSHFNLRFMTFFGRKITPKYFYFVHNGSNTPS